MSYTIEQIWKQAKADEYASQVDSTGYEARIVYGCRIVKDNMTGSVTLFNTGAGGDYYKEMQGKEVGCFLKNGWRYGCYEVSLCNYRDRLDRIEEKIRDEMNGRKNPKQIQSYKNSRESILIRYAQISNKLNKIK